MNRTSINIIDPSVILKVNKYQKRKVKVDLIPKFSELPGEQKDQIQKRRKTEAEPPKSFKKSILNTSTTGINFITQ
jgi:hypothetical protein